MITLYVEENNPITPDFYNNVIANLQFHRLRCSCGQAGCLSVHAYYHRHIKVPGDRLGFRICRVRCASCGKTHALLLELAIIFDFFALLYGIWIYLANADSVWNHPCSQCKPVVTCWFKTKYYLFFIAFCRKCHHSCLGILKTFWSIAEFKCSST